MTFQEGLLGVIRNGFCTVVNTLQDFGFGLDVGAEYRGTKATVDVLRFAQRLVCNREPSAFYEPPFTGGQCFTAYTVVVEADVPRLDGFPSGLSGAYTRSPVPGRIEGLAVRTIAGSPFNLYQFYIRSRDATGTIVETEILQAPVTIYAVPEGTFTTIARVDGLPDECGSPYPQPPPSAPGDRTYPFEFVYVDNSSNDINVNGSVTFGDIIIGNNTDVKIPFRVTIDDILPFTFNGDLSLTTGDINLNIGNPNYSPIGKPNPDGYTTDEPPAPLPDVPTDTVPPNGNEPEPETTRVIRGVFVTVITDESTGTVIDQVSAPDIIAPNLGYVNFLVAVSNRTAWTSDIAVKNHRWFCECPFEGGAIAVRGTPRPGVEWTITPVYLQQEKSQNFS